MVRATRPSSSPTHSFGGRVQYNAGPFEFGLQAKRTGKRYINDENLPLSGYGSATVSGYTLVDLDARWNLGETPWGNQAAIQLNITNLFDELYVGGFGGSLNAGSSPFVQIGAPRAASLSFVIGY
ncbi:TonB-dependent receptor domain-containing protein [Erythrobacter sp.]|uniref:TonB-dependent receptor domain-containing protein n=1 Tax=Erythrobacter sp. TaxID=1042 RepID=UPI00311EBF50